MNRDPNKVQKINLIKESINQNYCRLNNKFYKQTVGSAIGSPLSPILTEISMNNFENEIIKC